MQWLCLDCWKHGEIIFDISEEEALVIAERYHKELVDIDVKAVRVPSGMSGLRGSPIMELFPGIHCDGNIRITSNASRRHRFQKQQFSTLPFGDI